MKIGLIDVSARRDLENIKEEKFKNIGCDKILYLALSEGKINQHEVVNLIEMGIISSQDTLIVSDFDIISDLDSLLNYLRRQNIYIHCLNQEFDLYHPQDSALYFKSFPKKYNFEF
ncbi:hypothetical protein IQ37_04660 [Chryseobacterium piperi]|uniref:Resolvase/invertase-type recombinase catalytic domain-containing protein n=1 Tax=Chryseobacterium piperi TaxID=558152 RepID=A0A086BKR2_9FLAO|nr:hypothetical protein [Chryseobacterium piperi]ASW74363.1 hypothetical protein CJF12_08725 [Chryseobacterium piperi]KFF29526.1 hypothetical protein IQ37_04660 [Chryseobacterium piperi]